MSGYYPALTENKIINLVRAIRDCLNGRSNAFGKFTLTANASSTTASAENRRFSFYCWKHGRRSVSLLAHRGLASRIHVRNAAESGKPEPTRMTRTNHQVAKHHASLWLENDQCMLMIAVATGSIISSLKPASAFARPHAGHAATIDTASGAAVSRTKVERVITCAVLAVTTLLIPNHPAAAQLSQNWNWCSGEEWVTRDQRLAACTAIVETGGEPPAHLALAHCNRGMTYLKNNLIALGKLDPDLDKADLDRAMADFNEAVRLDPGRYQTLVCRGYGYFAIGDYDRAIADFDQAISVDSKPFQVFIARGQIHRIKGDLDRAVADFSEAIRHNPNNALAFSHRGGAYAAKKNYGRVISDLGESIRLDPKNADAFNIRCSTYFAMNDFDRAIADCNEAISLDPNGPLAYVSRGAAYGAKKNYVQAIADFTEAIRLEPALRLAYLNRGRAHSAMGDTRRANADFDRARLLKR
jgi:tetratricopeptide (TPR) repeat protein